MAWTKAKTAMVIAAGVLVVGTTIILCNRAWPLRNIPTDWSVLDGDSEQWKWANGKINAHSTTGDSIMASGREYHNVTLSAIVGTTNREASLAIRMQDAKNGYIILFVPDPWGHVDLVKRESGDETVLESYRGGIISSSGKSAKITVVAQGPLIEVRVNGTRVLRVTDSTFITGLIGFRIYGSPDWPCDATFSTVTF